MAPAKDIEKIAGLKDTQSRIGQLTQSQRILIVAAVAFAQLLGLLDQTASTTAVPSIAASLHIGSSISWVSTSFLAASTATQLIIGRLSDIFGRKATMIGALCMVMFGELLVGFAKNEIWLYACRAIAGFGAGSLGSQAQIVVTDITTMAQRGKYFGIIGTAVALGNGLGPVVGGLLSQHVGWQWVFWIISPLCATSIIVLIFVLPGSGRSENIPARLKMVDWFGVFMILAGTFLVLIPISEGGSTFPFSSPIFIVLLVVGLAIFTITFIVEWKFIKLPVIALYIFKQGYAVNAFLWQNIGIGWIYFGNLYFTPQYFQNARGFSPSRAGVLLLPLVVTHGVCSAISGNAVSRSGRYLWAIALGSGLWTIGLSCQAAFYHEETSTLAIALIGIVQGVGIGFCLQNNMVGILTNTYKRDRAVSTALRMFIRGIAGSIGIAASNAILNNTIQSGLKGVVPDDLLGILASSTADLDKMGLDEAQQRMVRQEYMKGCHIVFIIYAPIMAANFISLLPIKDRGLRQLDDKVEEESNASTQVDPEPAEKILEETKPATEGVCSKKAESRESNAEEEPKVTNSAEKQAAVTEEKSLP